MEKWRVRPRQLARNPIYCMSSFRTGSPSIANVRKALEELRRALSWELMFWERTGGEPKAIRLSDTFAGLRKSSMPPDIYQLDILLYETFLRYLLGYLHFQRQLRKWANSRVVTAPPAECPANKMRFTG